MAVKKSRTGKKKRPEYGPQGTKTNAVPEPTKQEIKLYKNARRANYASIGLLLVAMILLFISPNSLNGNVSNAVTVIIAYVLTVIAGCLILYTVKYVVPERAKMTKITAGVLIVIGAAGIFMTGSSLMNM